MRSIFADSAAFLIRCIAIGLRVRSIRCSAKKVSQTKSMIRLSKSTPPRKVSPPVAEHLEHVAGEVEHRDVERAAAEVVDEDLLVEPAVEPVGERRGGRLVDDPLHVEAGEAPGLLHRLALVVVVVGGDGDHRLLDRAAEELLGDRLHLREHQARDLRERVGLAREPHRRVALLVGDDLVAVVVLQLLDDPRLVLAADQALGAVDRVPGVGDHLVLRHPADEQVVLRGERDHRRQDQVPAIGRYHLGDLVAHRGDARVRGAEVDADDARLLCH